MTTVTLENLNVAQHKAVSTTEGPMMIIAGAGTGKTRVISSRILHLLLDKKVFSSQILALTFTEKATDEMIERVDTSMPLSYEDITIKTFHGFCESILREKGMEIGIDPSYKLINQAEQWLLIKNSIFSFELDYYRPLGNPNKFIHVLLNHFSRLKDEDITPDSYLAHAEANLDKATDDIQKEEAGKMLEVAKAYSTYQNLLIEKNLLDFGDLHFYALRLLEKRPSVLNELQERYKYILVDEFQDTNFAQNKLVMLLAKKHKNITVVGDDDQSIYKWRGASLSNIRGFEKDFPNANKVILTDNYRSTQNILNTSYDLIQNNNPHRLEAANNINKKLISHSDNKNEPVQIHHFTNYVEEINYTINEVQELVKSGVAYKDIAILVRANSHASHFADSLKEMGIPFTIRDTQGLLRFEEIKDIVALLKFLSRPQDDVAFFRLLCIPLFKIPMPENLDLVDRARKSDFEPLFYFLRNNFAQSNKQETLPGIEDDKSNLESVFKLFNDIAEFSNGNNVHRIIGEFLDKSGYVKDLLSNESQVNNEKIQHIAQFLELARDFESDGSKQPVRGFLDYLDSLQEAMGILPLATPEESDAVSISTIHSSKGLEFDYVFIPSVVNHRFPSIRRRDPIEIPLELLSEDLPELDMHIQEERRLFYVACTRARKRLSISYSDAYEGAKKWKVSPFVAEILDLPTVEPVDHSKDDTANDGARVHGSLKKNEESSEMTNKLNTLPDVNVNQLSYSRIDTFKICPLKYKFRYFFKIPTPQAHAANFGSSLHNTVNQFYEEIRDGANANLDRLKEIYESQWINGGYESKGHQMARKTQGWEIMDNFYKKESESEFLVPAFLERSFRLKIGKFIFIGRIDRIDKLDDGTYEVIDYKTGNSKKNINLKKDLQLSLYALACRDVYNIPVSKLSLYYLEGAEKKSTERSSEDLDNVKVEIDEVSNELVNSDFCATPGFHCSFCEYRVLCNAAP